MVVTIDSKFYSKLQLGISKCQEKTPEIPLKKSNFSICKVGKQEVDSSIITIKQQ